VFDFVHLIFHPNITVNQKSVYKFPQMGIYLNPDRHACQDSQLQLVIHEIYYAFSYKSSILGSVRIYSDNEAVWTFYF